MHSEEQWKIIGSCPLCDAPLYLMGDRVKYHDCPYEYMDDLVDSINKWTHIIQKLDLVKVRNVA